MKQIADELYPHAKKIVVVLDHLNIHTPSAFYKTFEPKKPDVGWSVLSSTLHPSTAVGRTGLKLSEVLWFDHARIAGFPIHRHWLKKFTPGSKSVLTRWLKGNGNSKRSTPG